MNYIKQLLACASMAVAATAFQPIMAQVTLSSDAYPVIVAPHLQTVSYRERTLCFDITANVDYTVSADADWLSVRKSDDGTIYIHLTKNSGSLARTANVVFQNEANNLTETLVITQSKDESVEEMPTDSQIKVTSATANNNQSGYGIENTYDGSPSTFWHTGWYNGAPTFKVSETNPAILTYNFTGSNHIDYINYITRSDGNSNGNFGQVEVYAKCGDETAYTLITSVDLKKSSGTHAIELGDTGLDNVKSIQIKVLSGNGDYASCAEMQFMQTNEETNKFYSYFTDKSLSELKPGVTSEQIAGISDEFIGSLAQGLYDSTYVKDYRVAEYGAKLSYYVQSDLWNAPGKYYDQRQGTTGINITKGKQAIAVSGLPDGESVSLLVTAWYVGKIGGNFDGGNPETASYTLRNGLNIINYENDWDGLAYICYYADANPELQPKVKVHFINGQINGYLSPDKTNDEMHELTANAVNTCMDLVGSKVHSVWTANGLHNYCKATDGSSIGYRQYMNVLDSLVSWEHYLLGFKKYNMEPDNRTFAYVNYTYYMFQGGLGVSFHVDQESRVLNCRTLVYNDNDAIWGLSHEWGHQHQMHPYFCWAGMSEVTNNMNSYYNIMRMGYHESDKINQWAPARKHFVDANYTDITPGSGEVGTVEQRYSSPRHLAYENRNLMNNAALRSYLETRTDSFVPYYSKDPEHALCISEVGVGETLCPFIMLYDYFTTHGCPDFAPDMYEALRQTDSDEGSTIEKKSGIDKYELVAATQNGNKNQSYAKLKEKFPSSVWVTKGYVNASSTQWENSMPYVLNYIRKVSRLSGYNLFPYFERWGFLRQVGLYIGDYGNKWIVFTPEMYNEFKADMDQLVTDGELKAMDDNMVEAISTTKDLFESGYLDFGTTPTFPN